MMSDIYFGVRLPFETAEAAGDSEDVLLWMLGVTARVNLLHLKRNPRTPRLYDSGVAYAPPDQTTRPQMRSDQVDKLLGLLREMRFSPEDALMVVRILRGVEVFLDVETLYRRGEGDCNELVPVRLAELWRAGVWRASPWLTKARNSRGGWTYHAQVLWPDGSSEDPSLILGMGGAASAVARAEEVRKNRERFAEALAEAAEHAAAGADPHGLAKQVDSLGLLPQGGRFRLPDRATALGAAKRRRLKKA